MFIFICQESKGVLFCIVSNFFFYEQVGDRDCGYLFEFFFIKFCYVVGGGECDVGESSLKENKILSLSWSFNL